MYFKRKVKCEILQLLGNPVSLRKYFVRISQHSDSELGAIFYYNYSSILILKYYRISTNAEWNVHVTRSHLMEEHTSLFPHLLNRMRILSAYEIKYVLLSTLPEQDQKSTILHIKEKHIDTYFFL